MESPEGTTMNVDVEIVLPREIDVKDSFHVIAEAVRSATSGRKHGWSKYDVRIAVTVYCPRAAFDDDRNLIYNAVHVGTQLWVRPNVYWQVRN